MHRHIKDIVVCPVCKGPLEYRENEQELLCSFDKLAYPIENDIPVLMEDKARQINSKESN
jgi:uncharacterized protein